MTTLKETIIESISLDISEGRTDHFAHLQMHHHDQKSKYPEKHHLRIAHDAAEDALSIAYDGHAYKPRTSEGGEKWEHQMFNKMNLHARKASEHANEADRHEKDGNRKKSLEHAKKARQHGEKLRTDYNMY